MALINLTLFIFYSESLFFEVFFLGYYFPFDIILWSNKTNCGEKLQNPIVRMKIVHVLFEHQQNRLFKPSSRVAVARSIEQRYAVHLSLLKILS